MVKVDQHFSLGPSSILKRSTTPNKKYLSSKGTPKGQNLLFFQPNKQKNVLRTSKNYLFIEDLEKKKTYFFLDRFSTNPGGQHFRSATSMLRQSHHLPAARGHAAPAGHRAGRQPRSWKRAAGRSRDFGAAAIFRFGDVKLWGGFLLVCWRLNLLVEFFAVGFGTCLWPKTVCLGW